MSLTINMKDGTVRRARLIDGGGISVHPPGDYEVHGYDEQGGFLCLPQKDIEAVHDADTGEEVEWGNPFFPGHPNYDPAVKP